MDLIKKAAYLKGMAEIAKIDLSEEKKKIFDAMLDLLEELAEQVNEMQLQLDEVDTDLADVEELFYEEDCDCCCDDDCDCDDEDLYELTCKNCGEDFIIDGEDLDNGFAICPKCEKETDLMALYEEASERSDDKED